MQNTKKIVFVDCVVLRIEAGGTAQRKVEIVNFCVRICGKRAEKLQKCGNAQPLVTPPPPKMPHSLTYIISGIIDIIDDLLVSNNGACHEISYLLMIF